MSGGRRGRGSVPECRVTSTVRAVSSATPPGRSSGRPTRGPRSRTRGWPQPGHGIVGTVRGLGRNRARRYRRINNTGSRSYVKRPPCYARRYCHRRWVRSTGGAGKRRKGGQDAVGTFYLQRRASSCNVAAARIASSRSTWTSPASPFLPLLPIRNRIFLS